jgi:hypothetical protein
MADVALFPMLLAAGHAPKAVLANAPTASNPEIEAKYFFDANRPIILILPSC